MYWQIIYAKNALASALPFQSELRALKRRLVPYPSSLDDWTVTQGIRMIQMLRRSGSPIDGSVVLELGSGWKPTIPLLFRAAGARRVILTDAQRLLDARLLHVTASRLTEISSMLSAGLEVREEDVRSRLATQDQEGLDQVLATLGMEYLAPVDARSLPLTTGSVDIVVSRAVLEHIPPVVISDLFDEFNRVLCTRTGLACHVVDNSDHWAHVDRRLSMVNFLRYSDWAWKWFAVNRLDYTNRLRHSDYLQLLENSGFRVVLDESVPDDDALRDLTKLSVDRRFDGRSAKDMAILTSYVVAAHGATGRAESEGDQVTPAVM